MKPESEALAAFVEAACVPLAGSHRDGTLDAARALLAQHPRLAADSIHAAAIVGDADEVRRHVAADAEAARAPGGPRAWDPLTHLCFSRFLRLDPSRSDGFVTAARSLLDAGADPATGFPDASHQPEPLHESALYGAAGVAHHAPLTRLLLSYGADPNDEEVPYHAPESYDTAVLSALVESGRLTDDSVATMLLRKADMHDEAGARYLLEHGADPNRPTRWGYTALLQALRRDNGIEVIAAMLAHGGDLTARVAADGRTGLSLAARRGRADVLALAGERGPLARLDEADALVAACARADAGRIAALTRQHPALVRAVLDEGGTLLAQFAGNGNTDGVRALLDLGVPVDAVYGGDGYFGIARFSTALHVAAWRGRPGTIALLVERGADVNRRDGAGATPLMLAVRACVASYWMARRSPEWVAPLVDAGASTAGVPVPCGYDEVDDLLRRART